MFIVTQNFSQSDVHLDVMDEDLDSLLFVMLLKTMIECIIRRN